MKNLTNRDLSNAKSKYWRDKQVSKLNRIEDEIVRRVAKVNFLDSKFDSSTEKLYSMSEEEIRAKFENWRRRLKLGKLSPSQVQIYKSFNTEIGTLSKSMKRYVKENIEQREQAYLKALEENGESLTKYKKLLNAMSDKEKIKFFSSDSFMMPQDFYYSSKQFVEFAELTHSSVIYAKLEDWVMNHTHILDDKVYSTFDKYNDYLTLEKDKREKRNQRQINYAKKHHSIYTNQQLKSLDKKREEQVNLLTEEDD